MIFTMLHFCGTIFKCCYGSCQNTTYCSSLKGSPYESFDKIGPVSVAAKQGAQDTVNNCQNGTDKHSGHETVENLHFQFTQATHFIWNFLRSPWETERKSKEICILFCFLPQTNGGLSQPFSFVLGST